MNPNLAQAGLALQSAGELMNAFAGGMMGYRPDWIQEEGLRSTDCKMLLLDRAVHLFGSAAPDLFADIEFELLEIRSGLKPHFHRQSESLLYLPEPNPDFEMLLDVRDGRRYKWQTVASPLLLCVPPMLVHGFHRSAQRRAASKLLVLVASYLHVEEGDTFYVDV